MTESITVDELQRIMDSDEGAVILDVRSTEAFQEWRVQGKHLHLVNIQNSKLKEYGVPYFTEIPRDREIVAVCAKGVAAQETANILRSAGYQAVYLEGGMSAWSEFYQTVCVVTRPTFSIYQIQRLAKGCLSYLITSQNEAVVVDPGRHVQHYLKLAEKLGTEIRYVFDTHLHADHISGGVELARITGAEYCIAKEEVCDGNISYRPLLDVERVLFGHSELRMETLRTPGHTPALTSFVVDNEFLLVGDTVFVTGLGRPDLKGHAEEMAQNLYDTVFNKFASFPDNMVILPSHFSDYREINDRGYVGAMLGEIRAQNSMFHMSDRTAFIESVVARAGVTPPNYQRIIRINQGVEKPDQQMISELEIGPNRCAVKN